MKGPLRLARCLSKVCQRLQNPRPLRDYLSTEVWLLYFMQRKGDEPAWTAFWENTSRSASNSRSLQITVPYFWIQTIKRTTYFNYHECYFPSPHKQIISKINVQPSVIMKNTPSAFGRYYFHYPKQQNTNKYFILCPCLVNKTNKHIECNLLSKI